MELAGEAVGLGGRARHRPADAGRRVRDADDNLDELRAVLRAAANCLARSDLLTSWEFRFVVSLPEFKRLSPKQMSVLIRVHERACVGGAR